MRSILMHMLYVIAATVLSCSALAGQGLTVQGKVTVIHRSHQKSGSADVVVWLTPSHQAEAIVSSPPARLVQKDKRFSPHVIAVRVGTEIEFPNQDPFFHDVFSIYRGKPFDLGLYESGSARRVKFSQPGVSYIFCNIHPEMSAAVVALTTPYFAVTSAEGAFQISRVPPGHYKVEFWYESASDAELASLASDLEVGLDTPPFVFTLHSSDPPRQHLDKYGQEYVQEKSKSY
jgi:plastocyanin